MSTGAPRVMLLILTMSLFSFVWSNDRRPEPEQRTVVAYNFESPCPVARIAPALPEDSVSTQIAIPVDPAVPPPALVQCAAFPTTISPGRYRITDDEGNVFEVTIQRVNEIAAEEPIVPVIADEPEVSAIELEARRRLMGIISSGSEKLSREISAATQPLQRWLTLDRQLSQGETAERN